VRVSIRHREIIDGVLFKNPRHIVTCTVQFSFTERQVIKQRGLEQYVIMERLPADLKDGDNPEKHFLYIETLLRGPDEFKCSNPVSAKNYQEDLTEKLHDLRDFLVGNTELGEETAFELE